MRVTFWKKIWFWPFRCGGGARFRSGATHESHSGSATDRALPARSWGPSSNGYRWRNRRFCVDCLLRGQPSGAVAMSLRPAEIAPVPAATAQVAAAAFPKGCPAMRMRDELGTVYDDRMFASLYPARGQPAHSPWRLALVTVLQFTEGLSDRQAADAVRGRIDWKYALSLELADPGFDFSVLCEFRARLIAGR